MQFTVIYKKSRSKTDVEPGSSVSVVLAVSMALLEVSVEHESYSEFAGDRSSIEK